MQGYYKRVNIDVELIYNAAEKINYSLCTGEINNLKLQNLNQDHL